MAEIIEGAIHRYHYEHRVIIEGGKPIQINLHQTGDVASHKEIMSKLGEIMSAVSDFVTAQKQFNKDVGEGIDHISEHVTGLQGDVKSLNDKIAALEVTPADLADFEALKADGKSLSDKLKVVGDAIHALDDLTPPVAPPTP